MTDAVFGPQSRLVSAFNIAVDDVVVDEREIVDDLDGDCPGEADALLGAALLPRQREPGAHELASPGEVFAHRGPQRRAEAEHGRVDGLGNHRSHPRQGLRCDESAVAPCRGGDRRHVPAPSSCRGSPTPVSEPRASARKAARWPLRTAPSMVAGQPVSHDAPARNKPGTSVTVAGRNAHGAGNRPERGGLLSRDDRVDETSPACRGEQLPQGLQEGAHELGGALRDVTVRCRERDGHTLAGLDPARGRAVEEELDGRVDAGHQREVRHLPV